MAANSESLEPTGLQPGDNPPFASAEQMAMLLGFESPFAPLPGEEIFVSGIEPQIPQPNALNYGSNEYTIAEVVYAFGYVAARLAYERKLLNYSPSRDTDFDPFAPFCPPLMQEAVDAVRNAVPFEQQPGRVRINAMGGHVLNLVLAYGAKPETRLFDMHNALGVGEHVMENIEAIHAEREAFERVMAEEARRLTAPVTEQSDATETVFTLNDTPAVRNETLTSQQILAAYEDGKNGYDGKTKKVDLKQFPDALRMVAIQNVVAAYLDSLGELPTDAKLYSLEEAELLLGAPEFDKKRGVIELAGGVTFNPRTKLYPVTGKNSLDVQFRVPGMTKNVMNAALAIMPDMERARANVSEDTSGEPVAEAPESEAANAAERDGEEEAVRPTTLSFNAVPARFIDQLAAVLDGTLPDQGTIEKIYEEIASHDPTRQAGVVGILFKYNGTIGRFDAFKWVERMQGEMRSRQPGRRERPTQASLARSAPPSGPTFAARTGSRSRKHAPHAEPKPRRGKR